MRRFEISCDRDQVLFTMPGRDPLEADGRHGTIAQPGVRSGLQGFPVAPKGCRSRVWRRER